MMKKSKKNDEVLARVMEIDDALKEHKNVVKALEEERERLLSPILSEMIDSGQDEYVSGKYSVSHSYSSYMTLDQKVLQEKYERIYNKCKTKFVERWTRATVKKVSDVKEILKKGAA